jgi:putative peptidoglycan lipid II flippase
MTSQAKDQFRQLFHSTAWVGFLTFLVKVLAIGRDMAMAYRYGRSSDLEVFLVTCTMVQFLAYAIAGSIPSAFIPLYARLASKPGASLGGFNRIILMQILCLCIIAIVFFGLYAPAWFRFQGIPDGSVLHSAKTTGWLILLLPIMSVQYLLGAVLQAQYRLTAVSLAPAWSAFTIGAFLLMVPGRPASTLTGAFLLGGFLETAWVTLVLRVHNRNFLSGPAPDAATVRQYWGQYLPIVFGAIFVNSNNFVDLLVASRLAPGSVAAISYANKVASGLTGVVATALGAVALPLFSRMIANGEHASIRKVAWKDCLWITAAGIPLALVLAYFSEPITRLVFHRGAFTLEDVKAIAPIQAMYILQIPFYFLSILLVRIISAFRKNHLLFGWTIAASVLNISLDLVLAKLMGPIGIALSTTLVFAIACPVMGYWVWGLSRDLGKELG